MKNYELIDAARNFLRLLRTLDEETVNETYQRLATEANDSELGQRLEARQGLCVAIQAEFARRAHIAPEIQDFDDYLQGVEK